jgi:hypothetical protein
MTQAYIILYKVKAGIKKQKKKGGERATKKAIK